MREITRCSGSDYRMDLTNIKIIYDVFFFLFVENSPKHYNAGTVIAPVFIQLERSYAGQAEGKSGKPETSLDVRRQWLVLAFVSGQVIHLHLVD